jgi:outer membrane immunogenic protein
MRKLLVGMTALAWCCAAVSAHAADQRPAPLKAPPVPIATWSGFYLGLDAGFQSTRTDLTLTSIATVGGVLGPQTITPGGATTLPYDGTGARFGAFGGYNWQASPQWVFGAEADFGWTDNKTTLNGVAIPAFFCCANIGLSSSVSTNWDASVRARAGFLVTPTFMVYLTGGGLAALRD